MPESSENVDQQLRVGGWIFSDIPAGWEPIERRGLRRAATNVFPSTAIATEDELQGETTLQEYLERQLPIVRNYFLNPRFEFGGAEKVTGVEEATGLTIRFNAHDGRAALQRQVYVRMGRRVGVLTFTTLESELNAVDPMFIALQKGATFSPAQLNAKPRPR